VPDTPIKSEAEIDRTRLRARAGSFFLSPLIPISTLLLCVWGMHLLPMEERDRFELAVLGAVVMTFLFQHEQREKRDLQNILIAVRMDSDSWDTTRDLMQNSLNDHRDRIQRLELTVYTERERRLIGIEQDIKHIQDGAVFRPGHEPRGR
jgi:hypothetical protein